MCRRREKLLKIFAKATARFSEEVRELGELTNTGDVNQFLDMFANVRKTRDECEMARVDLVAHVTKHGCANF
jgi:hypothetical protein